MLVIYGFSLHLSHFSNNRSGGWGASNKHSLLSITPLNRIHSWGGAQYSVQSYHRSSTNHPHGYNSWSKSARSLKYPPHWGALQDLEMTNATFFTTQQLSKLWLISKRFPKELDTTKMNNIFKFHQNPLTINAFHIKIKFKLKLGWGFSQRGMDKSQRWSIAHTAVCGRKAQTNNCTWYFGQNKSGKIENFVMGNHS
jgi:hypothetical protein